MPSELQTPPTTTMNFVGCGKRGMENISKSESKSPGKNPTHNLGTEFAEAKKNLKFLGSDPALGLFFSRESNTVSLRKKNGKNTFCHKTLPSLIPVIEKYET